MYIVGHISIEKMTGVPNFISCSFPSLEGEFLDKSDSRNFVLIRCNFKACRFKSFWLQLRGSKVIVVSAESVVLMAELLLLHSVRWVQQRRVNVCLQFSVGSTFWSKTLSFSVCSWCGWFARLCLCATVNIWDEIFWNFLAKLFPRRNIFWFWSSSSRRVMESGDFRCQKCPRDSGGMRASLATVHSGETIAYITKKPRQC